MSIHPSMLPRPLGSGRTLGQMVEERLIPPQDSLPIGLGEHGDFTNGPTNYEFRNATMGRTFFWDGRDWVLLRMDGTFN